MKTTNDGSTRDLILEVSTKLFSEKGFDGTRVSEIASEAKISQALIYYNFKSKQVILDEILADFKTSMSEMFNNVYSVENSESNSNWKENEIQRGIEFLMNNSRVLKILIFESFKTSSKTENLLDFWDSINISGRNNLLKQRGFSTDYSDIKRNITDAFFIFIPSLFFSILESEWIKTHDFDKTEVDKCFSDILNRVYTDFLR